MSNLADKRGLFIGQAPAENNYDVPFGRTRLYSWFSNVGLQKDFIVNSFEFESLVAEFPGKTSSGHNLPTDKDIQKHIQNILSKISHGSVIVIVPIGKLAIQYVLNIEHVDMEEVIGKRFTERPFGKMNIKKIIIPLPHPSGLSTWIFKNNNQLLLNTALKLIQNEIEN